MTEFVTEQEITCIDQAANETLKRLAELKHQGIELCENGYRRNPRNPSACVNDIPLQCCGASQFNKELRQEIHKKLKGEYPRYLDNGAENPKYTKLFNSEYDRRKFTRDMIPREYYVQIMMSYTKTINDPTLLTNDVYEKYEFVERGPQLSRDQILKIQSDYYDKQTKARREAMRAKQMSKQGIQPEDVQGSDTFLALFE